MATEPELRLGIYGMMAEFATPAELLSAVRRAKAEGYTRMEAYTPFPVHGLSEAIGFHDVRLPWMIFIGGISGTFFGFTLQWYTAVIDLPLNVGGKPLNSIPAFFPVTYEATILWAAFTAFFGMLTLNRLPKPYHSIFNTPGFERATQDRFFLAVEADDHLYDSTTTREFLQGLNPLNVSEVEP